nr:hypothetical protein CFP56_05103 [Quercus suber]
MELVEYNSSCLNGKSSDSPAVYGLEVGVPVEEPMVINSLSIAGFNSVGPAVAQMVLNGSSSDGFSSNDSTMVLGKTDMANPQLSKGIFLADILKRLSVVGIVDFGVKSVDKVGSESSVLLIQGANNKGTGSIDMGEYGKPNLVLMEPNSDCEEENLADCNRLLTIIPPGLELSMEVHNDSEEQVGSGIVEAMLSKSLPVFYGDLRSHERVPLPFSTFIGYCKQGMQNREFGCANSELEGHGLIGCHAEHAEDAPEQIYLARVALCL